LTRLLIYTISLAISALVIKASAPARRSQPATHGSRQQLAPLHYLASMLTAEWLSCLRLAFAASFVMLCETANAFMVYGVSLSGILC